MGQAIRQCLSTIVKLPTFFSNEGEDNVVFSKLADFLVVKQYERKGALPPLRNNNEETLQNRGSEKIIAGRRSEAAACVFAILPERRISLRAILHLVDSHLPLEMGSSVLVTLVVVPQCHAEAVVSLSIGTSLLGCIENVGGEIDSAAKNGKIARGHVVFLRRRVVGPGGALAA